MLYPWPSFLGWLSIQVVRIGCMTGNPRARTLPAIFGPYQMRPGTGPLLHISLRLLRFTTFDCSFSFYIYIYLSLLAELPSLSLRYRSSISQCLFRLPPTLPLHQLRSTSRRKAKIVLHGSSSSSFLPFSVCFSVLFPLSLSLSLSTGTLYRSLPCLSSPLLCVRHFSPPILWLPSRFACLTLLAWDFAAVDVRKVLRVLAGLRFGVYI